jgi:hypothetical protein
VYMIPGVVTGAQIAAALQGRFTKGGVAWCNGCDSAIRMFAWLLMAGNSCYYRSYRTGAAVILLYFLVSILD